MLVVIHYFFLLQACTSGGCTVSNATSAMTSQGIPQGVPDPVITSPSPSQLVISWGIPSSPNGINVN